MFHEYGLNGLRWFGGVGMALWGILLVGLAVLVSRVWQSHKDDGPRRENSPREIARRRYARGEIDREELDRIIRDLDKL